MVAEVLSMDIDQVTAFGKSPQTVKARRFLCSWAHRRLGMATIEIGRRLNITPTVAKVEDAADLRRRG